MANSATRTVVSTLVLLSTQEHNAILKHGTAIAAIRIPSEIVIAADSRVVDEHDRPLADECKIRVVGTTVFAAHGMSSDTRAGFDLFRIAAAVLRNHESLRDVGARIVTEAVDPLTRALERIRREAPLTFRRNAIEMAASGIILANVENGEPYLASIRFVAHEGPGDSVTLIPEVRTCPGPDCPDGIASCFVGPAALVEAFQNSHPRYWEEDLAQVSVAFVQSQIDRHLVDVGPPIDVVRISQSGIAWVHRKPGCAEHE